MSEIKLLQTVTSRSNLSIFSFQNYQVNKTTTVECVVRKKHFLFVFWVVNVGILEFLLVVLHTSLVGQPLIVVVASLRAVVSMEALDLEMVTGLVIAIETRGDLMMTMENQTILLQVTIKTTPSRRVHHDLSGRTNLTAVMVGK